MLCNRKEHGDSKADWLWKRMGILCTRTILSILPILSREYEQHFKSFNNVPVDIKKIPLSGYIAPPVDNKDAATVGPAPNSGAGSSKEMKESNNVSEKSANKTNNSTKSADNGGNSEDEGEEEDNENEDDDEKKDDDSNQSFKSPNFRGSRYQL